MTEQTKKNLGITGIVEEPVKGAIDDGIGGFVKGVGRGVVGVAVNFESKKKKFKNI